jgi:hypothetical protein
MKECDNSTRKIHISSNFILSISLLIIFDIVLLRPFMFNVFVRGTLGAHDLCRGSCQSLTTYVQGTLGAHDLCRGSCQSLTTYVQVQYQINPYSDFDVHSGFGAAFSPNTSVSLGLSSILVHTNVTDALRFQ